MKTIDLQTTSIDERQVIKELIGSAPSGQGYTIAQVRDACRVLEKMDLEGPLVLEDAEYNFLLARVQEQRWIVANLDIVAMVSRIESASHG